MKKIKFFCLKNAMLFGNGIVNFVAIKIIDLLNYTSPVLSPPAIIQLAQRIDMVYLSISFPAIFAVGLLYELPIRKVLNADFARFRRPSDKEMERARRRLLNEPFVLIALNLSAWMIAAILYPLVFYLNDIDLNIVVRTFFKIFLTGIISGIITFFVMGRVLQNTMVPIFFPKGQLYGVSKTIRIQIRTRLIALLFVTNLIPFFVIFINLFASTATSAKPEVILAVLRQNFLTLSFGFIIVGIYVTVLVSKTLTQPFGEIIDVLRHIREGRLNSRVQVTTNDEIGYTGDVINEMTEGLKERERLRHSLELAREVQQNLLPKSAPQIRGVDVAGTSIYCEQTGGDYFDYLELNGDHHGKMGIVVGDVSGHGIPSALLMATARAFLRLRSSLPGDVSQIVTDVNRRLTKDMGDSAQFMTLFYLVIDSVEKEVSWVRAGHDPAIFYDPAADTFEKLDGRGLALGIDETFKFQEYRKGGFIKGQTILIGTDGIWETFNVQNKMFGKEPLYNIMRENPDACAAEILDKVMTALNRFQQGRKTDDDTTLIVIKFNSDWQESVEERH